MNSNRFLPEDFLQVGDGALLSDDVDHRLRLAQSLLDDLELFAVVELGDQVQLGLVLDVKAESKRACKHESEVNVFFFCPPLLVQGNYFLALTLHD